MARNRSIKPPRLEKVDIELELNIELIERRRHVRTIPCPEAQERNDEESWSDWVTLSGMSPLSPQ
jgi:hypothetical protein